MEDVSDTRDLESLQSMFSDLEFSLSFSRDSSYASDESSVASAVTTITALSNVSPESPTNKVLVPRPPKSILKKHCTDNEDNTSSQSGYESDSEFEESLNFSSYEEFEAEFSGDELFDCGPASDSSFGFEELEISTESRNSYYESDFDDSYIMFENSVRFAPEVRYIEAPEFCNDISSEPEMTIHEMMELACASGKLSILQSDVYSPDNDDKGPAFRDDSCDDDRSAPDMGVIEGPEEHSRDIVDLDKQLFIAYMNGIHGVSGRMYKSRIQTRAEEIRQGRLQSPFFESETINGTYLNHVLNHVIGIFRSLVARDEFTELVRLCAEKAIGEHLNPSPWILESCTKKLLDKIEQLLSERLASGNVHVGKDELSFFAGGVLYAMENWSLYTYN